MHPARRLVLVLFGLLVALAGCGESGKEKDEPPVEINVTINPTTANVGRGQTQAFTATVTGSSNTSVAFTLAGPGSITSSGNTATYTAPDVASVPVGSRASVAASAEADFTKFAVATITIVNPAPTLTAISPAAIVAGSEGFALALTGTNFLSNASVKLNGVAIASQFVSPVRMIASVTANHIVAPGSISVVVSNVAPGGGDSSPQTLVVAEGKPVVTRLNPESITAGTATTLSIVGGYFHAGSLVSFNGVSKPPTLVDDQHLEISVAAGDVPVAGLYSVVVTNPGSGGGVAGTNLLVRPSGSAPTRVSVTGAAPSGYAVAVNPNLARAVVSRPAPENQVALVDLASNAVAATFAVGADPRGVAVNSISNAAVVANRADGTLSVLDMVSQTAAPPIDLGPPRTNPVGVAADATLNRAVAADPTNRVLVTVDLANSLVLSRTAVADAVDTVAIDPELKWALAFERGRATLFAMDVASGSLLSSFSLGAGFQAQELAVDPSAHAVAITNAGGNSMAVVDLLTAEVRTIALGLPTGAAAFNPQTGLLAVASGNNLLVVDPRITAGSPILANVPTSGPIVGLAFAVTTNRIVVTHGAASAIEIADAGPMRSISTHTMDPVSVSPATASSPVVNGAGFDGNTSVLISGRSFAATRRTIGGGPVPTILDVTPPVAVTDFPSVLSAPVQTQNATPEVSGVLRLRIAVPAYSAITGPRAATIDPAAGVAYLTNTTDSDVKRIDLTSLSNALTPVGGVPAAPGLLAANPVAGTLVAAEAAGNRLFVLDPSAATPLVRTVTLSQPITGLAVNQQTNAAVAAHAANSSLSIVDLNTGIVNTLGLPGQPVPNGLAVDSVRNTAWVALGNTNAVVAVGLSSGALGAPIAVGAGPVGVAVNRTTGVVVVTSATARTATIISSAGATTTVPLSFTPGTVAIHFRTNTAVIAVTGGNLPGSAAHQLALLRLDGSGFLTALAVGQRPVALALDPNRALAITVNDTDGSLSVVPLPD
ncbi:MAG TPA: IPT/TIG domain-containing protein [Candidatus Acidoferrales bacterium]